MSIPDFLKTPEHPMLMGILNITPDSFYDGGRYLDPAAALDRAWALQESGARIIDVGGESSRPGSAPVNEEEELRRVLPVVRLLTGKLKIPVSVDTRRGSVARAVLAEGAAVINDISGLRDDPELTSVAAQYGAYVVIMHMQGRPGNMQKNPRYRDVVAEVRGFLEERVRWALERGVAADRIILDPGIGFGKTLEHNLKLMAHLPELRIEGHPLLIGASRKSFIDMLCPGTPPEDRLAGTLAAHLYTVIRGGAEILRVHDVAQTRQMLRVWRALEATRRDRGAILPE
jgi:dihydropteroate synthase